MRASIFLIVAMWLAVVIAAGGHQPYESTTVARLQHGRLEVVVVASAQISSLLLGDAEIDDANFESLRPRLQERAHELYEVQAGGVPLQLERTSVSYLRGETHFLLIYPAPQAWPLRFRAKYLDQLPDGYGGSLLVLDEAETLLGHQPLLLRGESRDAFSISQPGIVAPKAASRPLASAGPVPVVAPEKTPAVMHVSGFGLAAGMGGLLLLAGLWAGWHSRKRGIC